MYDRVALACILVLGALGLIAQSGREAYRQSYDGWRQAHANLERDAGPGGAAPMAQADRAASGEAKFQASRADYLKANAQTASQQRQLLQTGATRPMDLAAPAAAQRTTAELQTVTRTIARFADDKDRGIQQLSQALERERIALAALNDTIQVSQKALAATSGTVAALEQARAKTAEAFGEEASRHAEILTQLEKEGAAWSSYYEKLTQAMQVANAPPPPVSVTPAPTPGSRNTSISVVPLPRFVGAWTYPAVNGVFHGAQPEFVDLVVHEQNGHAEGTLFGRFKPASGSAIDPLVRFDFQGDFSPGASQRFTLVSSDGAPGTLELIPGPAFNLLEVNFLTDPRPNKIRAGNFILVKK